jgi:hypothetical protein
MHLLPIIALVGKREPAVGLAGRFPEQGMLLLYLVQMDSVFSLPRA